MNERIKDLAVECHPPYGNFDHAKFADLIIKDVLKIMSNPVNYNSCVYTTFDLDLAKSVARTLSTKIQDHFKDTQ